MTAERARLTWIAPALAAGSALVLMSAPAQYLGRQQDDLLYIVASQSLARGSYRLSTVVGRPLIPMITPGWPALLLPISWLFPRHLGAYEAFAAALQALVPWACYAWLRRREVSVAASLLAALLCASSPLLLSQAGAVMSETPFLLAELALLAALDSPRRDGKTAGAWLAGLLLLRPAAAALFPATLAPLRRKARQLAWAAAMPALALGAWAFLGWLAARGAPTEAGKRAFQGRSWLHPFALGGLDKPLFYARALGGAFLPRSWAEAGGAAALGALLLALAAWGCVKALRRRTDEPAVWALGGTAALHLAWGWTYERYWIPMLPLLWWACATALGRRAAPALGALLALQLAFGAPAWVLGTSWRTPELSGTYSWLASNLPPDAALASAAYLRDGYYAGRPSAPLPDADGPAEFARQLAAQRVRYVLWQDGLDIGGAAALEDKLARAQASLSDPRYFTTIHEDDTERARVYLLK